MKTSKSFPFSKARKITSTEVESARVAIEEKTGKKRQPRRGRPAKADAEKFVPISIKLHPQVLAWAKREARKRGIGYQTVINEALLKKAV